MSKKLLLLTIWIKNNWIVIISIITVLTIFSFLYDSCQKNTTYENLFNKYKENIEEHQKEIEDLKKLQDDERKKREEQYQIFIEEMKRIEQNYSKKLIEIEKDVSSKRIEIVKLSEKDPNILTKKIKETFGIPIFNEQ